MNKKVTSFLKSFIIWFLVFYLVAWGFQKFFGKDEPAPTPNGPVIFELKDDSITRGNLAVFEVENQSDQAVKFTSPCARETETFKIFRVVNGQKVAVSDFENCDPESVPGFTVQPEGKMKFSLREYNQELFAEEGTYAAEITLDRPEGEALTLESEPFEFNDPGMFRQLFRAIISRPLFNLLVFFTQTLPGHPLGWSVVILTLIVRALLFVPNQKAMRSQRRLQKLQPQIAELREKHKGNQQAIAMKTMELYKSHKVSPMSSCLPMLLQLPILLGLYYIVRDGLSPHLSFLLYSFQQGVDLTVVNPQFFGLNLNARNMLVLPIIVGVAQWIAIRMSLVSAKKRKSKETNKSEKKLDKKPAASPMQMESMNKAMQWVMPLMIGFFAASLPAAVGIYWLTSTLFGIGQQKLVNWQLDRPQVVRKKES